MTEEQEPGTSRVKIEGTWRERAVAAMIFYGMSQGVYVGPAEAEAMAALYESVNDLRSARRIYMEVYKRSASSFALRIHRLRRKGLLRPLIPREVLAAKRFVYEIALD